MKLHRFDALSFIAGLVITGVGLVFLLLPEPGDIIDAMTDFGSWFWPLVFIAIGVAVLAPLAARKPDDGGEGELGAPGAEGSKQRAESHEQDDHTEYQ